MSKLDVSASSSGVRLAVNPEVKLRALIEITQNMSKALSHAIVLGPARLLGKRGGKRDFGREG